LLYFRQLLIGLYFSCKIFLVLNFEVFLYLVVLIRFCRGVLKHLYFPCNNCSNYKICFVKLELRLENSDKMPFDNFFVIENNGRFDIQEILNIIGHPRVWDGF